MIEAKKYNDDFFLEMERGSLESAKNVLPIIDQFIKPKSVVDVGCGTGVWLSVWENDLGVYDYLGIEGPYVKKEMIRVPQDKVLFKDLKQSLALDRTYDLAMSLEVAEHLPMENAKQFISELTALSKVVLFSAAIPGQGGTHHINEQYPEYWADIFLQFRYVPVDCVRPLIWNNNEVEFWYRQNILLFVKHDALDEYQTLLPYARATNSGYLSRIHPVFFDLVNQHISRTRSLVGFLNWKWYMLKKSLFKRK